MNPRADIGPKPTPTPRPQPGPGPTGPRFRVCDHVLVDGDRPEDGGWWITQIITDEPEHDGPFAILYNANGDRSWSALRILRYYEPPAPPDLADLIDAADVLGARLIGLLKRGYDPATGPADDGSVLPGFIDLHLRCAAADIRSALASLAQIRTAFPSTSTSTSGTHLRDFPARHHQRPATQPLPRQGEGVEPAPTGRRAAEAGQGPEGRRGAPVGRPEEAGELTTGPTSGECLTPGYAAVPAARESEGAVAAPTQANTNPAHTAGERFDTPSRTIGAPVAMAEAPGTSVGEPGAGVQLLTRTEVAEMFGVDPKSVTRWEQAGRIGCIRTLGGHRRYRESDVRALREALSP